MRNARAKSRLIRNLLWLGLFLAAVAFGVMLFTREQYVWLSLILALIAGFLPLVIFEQRQGSVRRLVLISGMTALATIGRLIFAALPSFKPSAALIILCGAYLGPEAGFVTGAMTALVSNIFFGQGPWTPLMMLAWGAIGMISGYLFFSPTEYYEPSKARLIGMTIWGAFAGFLYSIIMDFGTVLMVDRAWNWSRYIALQIAALPTSIIYAVSNAVFILLMAKPVGRKLARIERIHGVFH